MPPALHAFWTPYILSGYICGAWVCILSAMNKSCFGGLWQVFLFCANDKGASWAYATPGFGASLSPAHLRELRQMANPDSDDATKVHSLCHAAATALLFVHFQPACSRVLCGVGNLGVLSSGKLTAEHLTCFASCPQCPMQLRNHSKDAAANSCVCLRQ